MLKKLKYLWGGKGSWVLVAVLTFAIAAAIILRGLGEDEWVCGPAGWERHGNPAAARPLAPCGDIAN